MTYTSTTSRGWVPTDHATAEDMVSRVSKGMACGSRDADRIRARGAGSHEMDSDVAFSVGVAAGQPVCRYYWSAR